MIFVHIVSGEIFIYYIKEGCTKWRQMKSSSEFCSRITVAQSVPLFLFKLPRSASRFQYFLTFLILSLNRRVSGIFTKTE